MNLLTFLIWFPIIILIHEFGHAITAHFLGFKVYTIEIGYGRQIFELRLKHLILRVNLFPLIGLTTAIHQSNSMLRFRFWLFTLAGPLTHILLIGTCYFIWKDDFFDKHLFGNVFNNYVPLQMFIYANIWFLFVNLLPAAMTGSGGIYHTDGYNLLKIPFMKDKEFENFKLLHLDHEARELMRIGESEKAITIYEKILKEKPDHFTFKLNFGVAVSLQGDYERAREIFVELLSTEEAQKLQPRTFLLNNIASMDLYLRKKELLAEAAQYSAEAYQLNPNLAWIAGTRGEVLVRLGKIKEGVELLKYALRRHSEPRARADIQCCLALAEAKKGNQEKAKLWIEKARKECPDLKSIELYIKEIDNIFSLKVFSNIESDSNKAADLIV